MPTKPKTEPQPDKESQPDKLESLRAEIIEILEEYLDALNKAADNHPGEHNVDPIRNAQNALRMFRPDPPNIYT